MKTYRLKEDFYQYKKGYEIATGDSTVGLAVTYKGNDFVLRYDSDMWEEVKKVAFTTDEEEFFWGEKGKEYYTDSVARDNAWHNVLYDKYIGIGQHYSGKSEYKRFTTKAKAFQYVKLVEAIEKSGLKVGDFIANSDTKHYVCTHWSDNSRDFNKYWYVGKLSRPISFFKIFNGVPCAFVCLAHNRSPSDYYVFPLEQFYKPNLTFGGKPVLLTVLPDREIGIETQGLKSNYSACLKFVNALDTLKAFSFAGAKFVGALSDKPVEFKDIKLGCTTGTRTEIDAIIKRCEELLKENDELL